MNHTERLAYDWLKASGHTNIRNHRKGIIDFSTDKGLFEVKKLTIEGGLFFQPRQLERILAKKATILIYDTDGLNLLRVVNSNEITDKENICGYKASGFEWGMKVRISISIDEEDLEKLEAMVDSGDAVSISHAVSKTVRAYSLQVEALPKR